MNTETLMKKIFETCDIYYDNELISREHLIKIFTNFISVTINQDTHNYGLILHTGSICFDIVLIFAAVFGNILLDETNPDEIIKSLKIGDIVLYKGSRYTFKGLEKRIFKTKEVEYINLETSESLRTLLPYENYKHFLQPYYGDSFRMDGRGIRNDKDIRRVFINEMLGINMENIPITGKTSTVIVMSKNQLDSLVKKMMIKYDKNSINILDLATISYFSDDGNSYQYGNNPSKSEPMLKVTGKISNARKLIMDKTGNKILGLFVLDYDAIKRGRSELIELINRHSLIFVFVSFNIDAENAIVLLDEYSDTKFFPCTEKMLKLLPFNIISKNQYTKQLFQQIYNIKNRKINPISVPLKLEWPSYRDVILALFWIRKSAISGIDIDNFMIYSYSLLNLFLSCPFNFEVMEKLFKNNKIDVKLPKARIFELQNILDGFSGTLYEKGKFIVDKLSELYNIILKENLLRKYLIEHIKLKYDKKIAIISPKKYYIDIMIEDGVSNILIYQNDLQITTFKKFNFNDLYDEIIIIGNFKHYSFELYNCKSSAIITPLVYDVEIEFVKNQIKKLDKVQQYYNSKASIPDLTIHDLPKDYNLPTEDKSLDDEIFIFEKAYFDLNEYISSLENYAVINHFNSNTNENIESNVLIYKIGILSNEEKIFFTKDYRVYVLDNENEEVKIVKVDELESGDTLVFTSNNSVTKDLVDNILQMLIEFSKLSDDQIDAYKNYRYWKEQLIEFMKVKNYSYKKISEMLYEIGCSKHEVTIRSWLEEDYHIVGPMEVETYKNIGVIINDKELIDNHIHICNSCKVIRNLRVRILKLIALSIINKISGQYEEEDIFYHLISDKIDNIVRMCQLESIVELEEDLKIPLNLVNKPIEV